MRSINLGSLMLFSAFLRLILVIYGEWQDVHMEVRYTDVDYLVFSDAAALVSNRRSPFERSTYRYSPLLSFLLVPNSILHRSWGKILFSSADLLVGFFVDTILKLRGVPENLHFGLWQLGSSIHSPSPLVPEEINVGSSGKPALQQWNPRQHKLYQNSGIGVAKPSIWLLLRNNITKERVLFGLFAGAMFFFWTALFFYIYGWDFLNEAFLYHLTRTDPRYNFSIYFYCIYLHRQQGVLAFEKLISFLPQLMVELALIFRFSGDLPFCLFVQTVAFVAFNKVITAQYFVWFFCLLPLILPWGSMKLKWNGLICIFVWMGSQVHWLIRGYLLEFKGRNVFIQLWVASLMFLAANTWVLLMVIEHHSYLPVFKPLASSHSSDARILK